MKYKVIHPSAGFMVGEIVEFLYFAGHGISVVRPVDRQALYISSVSLGDFGHNSKVLKAVRGEVDDPIKF